MTAPRIVEAVQLLRQSQAVDQQAQSLRYDAGVLLLRADLTALAEVARATGLSVGFLELLCSMRRPTATKAGK